MATTDHRRKRLPLLLLIFIAIAAGIGLGFVLPAWAIRIFATFNGLFGNFLGFVIPLLIVGLVAPSIIEIGRRAGRMLVFTVALAYVATLFAGFFSYSVCSLTLPSLIEPGAAVEASASATAIAPFFTIDMPPLMSVNSALVLAFMLGLCVAAFDRSQTAMRDVLSDLRDVIVMVIKNAIVPLLPLYIFGIFLNMTATGGIGDILSAFLKVIAVIFAMHIVLIVVEYVIGALIDGKNPFKCMVTMLPAYFTALGTSSSAATIPVTLRQAKTMGVDCDIADFTIPLCATIHLSGSTLKIVACAMALMILRDYPFDFQLFAGFIAMLAITMVAAPGVPGGAIMAALGILGSILGFNEADCALMIAIYIAIDSFGTACNVTGDGAIALIVDRFFGRRGAAAECHQG